MRSKSKYKISVIIVCHPEYQEHLRKALQSLNNQNLKDFQIILVLNGYKEIPQLRADNDITILRIPDTNLATACNIGVKASTGEYIIRLDADDKFHTEILKRESGLLDTTKTDAVFCNFYLTVNDVIVEVMEHKELEHACGVMYRRDVFDKLNGYDELLEYQESFDFWIRFRKAGFKARHLDHPYYYYKQHHGSMSTNTQHRAIVRQQILDKYK